MAGPEFVRTAQQAQPARLTRVRICRAWSRERATPNPVGPLPDMIAPSAPAAKRAAFMRPITGRTGSNNPERVVEPGLPVIGRMKAAPLAAGALGAIMSGSGPTVFGLARSLDHARQVRSRVTRV